VTRRVTVALRTARGRLVEEVDASLLATDEAVVDFARLQAGVSPAEFGSGEVVS